MDGKHGRTLSGVSCHHRLWAAHPIERHLAWHAIIAFKQHTRSNDVRRGMLSWPLDSSHGRTTSGVAFHHSPWTANTVKRRRARIAIIAFELADTVERRRAWTGNTIEQRRAWHAIIAFWQHTRWNDIGHGIPSSPLDNMHGRMTSGVACHHRLWAAHTIERHSAWHAIMAFKKHTQSIDVGRGMLSVSYYTSDAADD